MIDFDSPKRGTWRKKGEGATGKGRLWYEFAANWQPNGSQQQTLGDVSV
jgi:hypothetical protein